MARRNGSEPRGAGRLTVEESRWAAILARDATCDGEFLFAVTTTGIYCRPSCPARRARRDHVRFFETRAAAEKAGFRACKRCRPDALCDAQRHAAIVAGACRTIAAAEAPLSLAALASVAGLSPYHFHRVFKSVTGLTPKAYAVAERAKRLRAGLAASPTVTEAMFDAGYASSARFYATARDSLGMTPKALRAGAPAERIAYAVSGTSLGAILVAATGKGLCAILLGDTPEALIDDLRRRFPQAERGLGDKAFRRTVARVVRYVEAPRRGLDLPLDIRGTAFQHRVWTALTRIPPGETVSYAEIAARIGAPRAVRAVAQACASNAIAVAVPCHRVVRSDGTLSGYRWGITRKRALLDKERKD